MEKILFEAVDLCKQFQGLQVLSDISFKLYNQSSVAIVGQNGSGKSILLKLLAGIYEPSSGKIYRNTMNIGYVPEHFPENFRFKVKEYLSLTASFNGLSKSVTEKMKNEYIHFFGLEQFINTPLKQCSKGTKQKVGIIQALLMKPDVLLLDEPLTGLDERSQHKLFNLIHRIKEYTTVIFTTHDDAMIDKFADKVMNVESNKVSFLNATPKSKMLIKIKFQNQDVFREFDLIDIQYKGDIALLTVYADICDQILIKILNNNCSVLEVKEKR